MALWNFSWVMPGKLAGSSLPGGYHSDKDECVLLDLQEMHAKGVRCLISLQRMDGSFGALCEQVGLAWMHYPLEDFAVPNNRRAFASLIASAIEHIDAGRPVCVHCQAGIGRTGLVLACIVGEYLGIDARMALQTVRKSRLAIDTEEQERFVHDFLSARGKA